MTLLPIIVRRMVYSKGGHSMRNNVNLLIKLVSLSMKREEGPAPGSTCRFFIFCWAPSNSAIVRRRCGTVSSGEDWDYYLQSVIVQSVNIQPDGRDVDIDYWHWSIYICQTSRNSHLLKPENLLFYICVILYGEWKTIIFSTFLNFPPRTLNYTRQTLKKYLHCFLSI